MRGGVWRPSPLGGQYPYHLFEVFGCLDAGRLVVVLRLHDLDAVAVLHRLELLEGLGERKGCIGKGDILEQEILAEAEHADMLVHGMVFAVAGVGYRCAGEQHGIALDIDDDLDRTGIVDARFVGNAVATGGHDLLLVGDERDDHFVDNLGNQQRLVTLDIQHIVAMVRTDNLGDTVATGHVFARGHDNLAPEGGDRVEDALVVGGDHEVVQQRGQRGDLIHALDHGFATDIAQGLSGQSGRIVADRNHPQDEFLLSHRYFIFSRFFQF